MAGIYPSGTVTFLFTDVGLYVTALAGVEILPHFRSGWRHADTAPTPNPSPRH